MSHKLLFLISVLIIVTALLIISRPKPITTISPTPTSEAKQVDIKASFKIITQGIVRSFKAEKYHQRFPDVFIQADDPTIIHIKKKGITWDDFFKTLPMKLTKDCLTTGDGETFCTGSLETLRFYLNGVEDPDLLDKEIREDDQVLIQY